jgi:hypothetical protein
MKKSKTVEGLLPFCRFLFFDTPQYFYTFYQQKQYKRKIGYLITFKIIYLVPKKSYTVLDKFFTSIFSLKPKI